MLHLRLHCIKTKKTSNMCDWMKYVAFFVLLPELAMSDMQRWLENNMAPVIRKRKMFWEHGQSLSD